MVYRSKKYLEFIRSKPCLLCANPETVPHHVRRQRWGAGTGIKPHDYVCIPLCHRCHDPKIEKEIDVELVIIDLLMEYIDETKDCKIKERF